MGVNWTLQNFWVY